MGRMIDADAIQYTDLNGDHQESKVRVYVAFKENIDRMPTVDSVEVVRCKDCKWYQPDADKWCGYFERMGFEPDNYCSQGERKGGNNHE